MRGRSTRNTKHTHGLTMNCALLANNRNTLKDVGACTSTTVSITTRIHHYIVFAAAVSLQPINLSALYRLSCCPPPDLSLNTLERIHTTQDMACVSDIDLATLHRNRLEERVHYKLSWWARRIITDTQKQLKNHRNVILSTGRSLRGRQQQQPTARSTASGGALPDTTTIHPSAERCHRGQRINAAESAFNLEQKEREAEQRLLENCCYKKDDYFTTERRRRSGTWP